MQLFTLTSLLALVGVAAVAKLVRGKAYAIFVSVVMGLFTAISISQYPRLAWAGPLRDYLQAVAYLHFLLLAFPRLRPLWFRLLVSMPAAVHMTGTLMAAPWALAGLFGLALPWPWLPYVGALVGLAQSLLTRESEVDLVLDGEHAGELKRYPAGSVPEGLPALRIVQITDPHLGPFMSVPRLQRICQRAVEREPDLIVLTGDFLTMESQGTPEALAQALEPLKAAAGKVYACFGNHDHEAPELVKAALAENQVTLLMDEAVELETPVGPVQLLGLDHRWGGRRKIIPEVCARWPRPEGFLRIVLLHDPSAFPILDHGEADLVLSGHTHGGQVGLLSLGLPWTFLRLVSSMPDYGLWAHGPNRLYVHRGTGHYGFPLRVGVPSEESLVRVFLDGQGGRV